ncbi:response regulator [Desulfobacterales bacterium HSG2]|nr:response regulator [Desulfobacterales bacterium HSG2]
MNTLKDTGNIHLLLVEDEQKYLNELIEWLKIFGYKHITSARSAKEAREKLDRPVDIIIADMRMETDDSGFAVVDEVKRRGLSSVVIILTYNDTVDDCRKAFKMGAWDYIRKDMPGNVFEVLHQSVQEAVTYLNRWGNVKDERWIDENMDVLLEDYSGQYVAVINNKVIGTADSREELEKQISEQRLPRFLTIRNIKPPINEAQIQQEIEKLREYTQPVVYVEGKTDREILQVAWKKLFGETSMPFIIKACDPLPSGGSGGSGGAGTLESLIRTVQADSPCFVIGIFDRDSEGIKAYGKLPKYLEESPEAEAKIGENRKTAAFLLPVPPGKEDYVQCLNLCIEFYFSEAALSQKTAESWGLEFRYPDIETKIMRHGNPVISVEQSDLPGTREIMKGKTVFAEKIVPELDNSEFEPFRMIFEQIERVLHLLESEDGE